MHTRKLLNSVRLSSGACVVGGKSHRASLPCVLLVLLGVLGMAAGLQSCFLFPTKPKVIAEDPALLRPEIAMSDDYIRSKPGDLLAFMPKGWFLVDVNATMSADVIAVAVNPDYTLSMVIQTLRADDAMKQAVQQEGLVGLARAAFDKRSRKSTGGVRLLSAMEAIHYGTKQFGAYDFCLNVTDSTAQRARSVVLQSSLQNYYEVSLVPTPITTNKAPDAEEQEKIFHSIVVSLRF